MYPFALSFIGFPGGGLSPILLRVDEGYSKFGCLISVGNFRGSKTAKNKIEIRIFNRINRSIENL